MYHSHVLVSVYCDLTVVFAWFLIRIVCQDCDLAVTPQLWVAHFFDKGSHWF